MEVKNRVKMIFPIIRSKKNDQFLEAFQLLSTRLSKNNINLNLIKNKIVLDMGCGNGRYCYALKRIGARKIFAIDNNTKNNIKLEGVKYSDGSILNLPYKDNFFDFVFCNGRLSHTKNWKRGVKEAYRVLKPSGFFWLSLYGKGKIWDYVNKLSKKLTKKDAEYFKKYLIYRDWEAEKISFLIDSFFSKDRIYFTKDQIKSELAKNGFKNIKFLERGANKDMNEKIFNNPGLKKIYGEGEIRIIAQK